MSMIFPGMDPYLEDPELWPGVHASLIVYIRDLLQPHLRPRYIAAIEERVFIEGPDREVQPDLTVRRPRTNWKTDVSGAATATADAPLRVSAPPQEIHESYINILDRQEGLRIVTVIEVLSPTNKYAGAGRDSYMSKQREVLSSAAHLVEIDLLRLGPHVLAVPERVAKANGLYDYMACVNRAEWIRADYELYPRRCRERLPRVSVPLADDDPDVTLDLQAAVIQTYEMGAYRDRIDYVSRCVPPLSAEDQVWADGLIREATRAQTPQE